MKIFAGGHILFESDDIIIKWNFPYTPMRLSNQTERIKDEWNAFAAVQRICITDMKMKVRADSVTGISKQTNYLTFPNRLAGLHANAAWFKVSIESITVVT